MRQKLELVPMVDALRHLLGAEQNEADFTPPSLLKEVPLINATDTVEKQVVIGHATLGRNT